MIKAFLFDYGGVVTEGGGAGNELAIRLAGNLGITTEKANDYLNIPEFVKFMKGEISEQDFWKGIENEFGKPIDEVKKRSIWNSWEIMKPLPEMEKIIATLHARKLTIGLLSNTIPTTEIDIRLHGGYDMFDFTVISCDVGYVKPDKAIYDIAMRHLPGVQSREVVFLDDQERCLVPARELGMQTIQVKSPHQAIEDIKQLIKV